MATSPMVEVAVTILEKHGSELPFNELWEQIIEEMELDKEVATRRIAKLYSDLTLDKRIVSLPENKWDLKKRRKVEDFAVASDIIVDDEDEDLDVEDYDYDYEDEDDKDLDDEYDDDEDLDDEIFDESLLDEEFEEELEEFEKIANTSED